MTDRELMQQALEALIGARAFLESDAPVEIWGVNDKAITALRERLAQPEQWQGLAADSTIQTVPAQAGLLPAQFGIRGGLAQDTLAQPEQREVEIEFKEWMHPQIGVVPVDSKTPLILKAHIREKNA